MTTYICCHLYLKNNGIIIENIKNIIATKRDILIKKLFLRFSPENSSLLKITSIGFPVISRIWKISASPIIKLPQRNGLEDL